MWARFSSRPVLLWYCSVVFACGVFVLWHTFSVERYLTRVSQEQPYTVLGEREHAPRRDISLAVAADGQTWLRLTEERVGADKFFFDRTLTDNAPLGREVHWSSWWSWWLEGGARVRLWFTGEDFSVALDGFSRWANLPLWGIILTAGSIWVNRRWGVAGAAVFCSAVVGHRGFYMALYPAYPDHHGAVALLTLGMLMGLAGVYRSDEATARRAVIFSALCGAWGLALSASSLVLPIALAGLGGMVGFLISPCRPAVQPDGAAPSVGESGAAVRMSSDLWRLWGRVGAGAATALYVLEYGAGDMGWRLEVNHPLFALAWWGGAEVVAWVIRVRAEGKVRPLHGWAVAGALAVAAPIVVVMARGGQVFAPMEDFIAGVHRHIDEFKSMGVQPARLQGLFGASLLLPLAGAGVVWRRLCGAERGVVAALVVMVAGTGVLAWVQMRWWSLAAAAQIPLLVVVTAALGRANLSKAAKWGWAAAVAAMVLPGPWYLARERVVVERLGDVQSGEAMQLLYRDVASVLDASAKGGEVVLLAFPNMSVAAGFYGGARTVGTLYWENGDGLRAAAEALTAADDAVAERLLKARGVTHVALVTPGDFTAEYADALGLPAEAVAESLARRALEGRDAPVWLRAIPYRVPPQFGRMGVGVALYAVDWKISRGDSRWALGMARLFAGDEGAGRAALGDAAEAGRREAGLILAWRMATAGDERWRDGAGAVRWAEEAIYRLPESGANRRVLAAAYAAAGRWPDALATAMFAADLAKEAGDAPLAKEIEADFERYRQRQSLVK